MTMLSAQPLTLTGEQHDRLWREAKSVRERGSDLCALRDAFDTLGLDRAVDDLNRISSWLGDSSRAIERILIDAQDSAPSMGEAA